MGSILVADAALIERARMYRKMWGGGWRQSGLIAHACNYALDNHLGLLKKDHEQAKRLYKLLVERGLDATAPETNMVYYKPRIDPQHLQDQLEKRGIHIFGSSNTRLVIHFQNHEGIEYLVNSLEQIEGHPINRTSH
jgi:threonine aldolase